MNEVVSEMNSPKQLRVGAFSNWSIFVRFAVAFGFLWSGPVWGQFKIVSVSASTGSFTPGATIDIAVGLSSTSGPTVTSPCQLTLTARGQQTPVLALSESFPPLLWTGITLPVTLNPGPYLLACSSNGVTSNAMTINVTLGPPTVTALNPSVVQLGAGTTATVVGTGFGQSQGSGYIHLIGNAIPDVYVSQVGSWSNTQIIFVVPSYALVGTYQLVVSTDSNGKSSPFTSNGSATLPYGLFVVPFLVQTGNGVTSIEGTPPLPGPIALTTIPASTPLVSMFVAGPCVISQSGVNVASNYGFTSNFWDGVGNGCANHVQHLIFNEGLALEPLTDSQGNPLKDATGKPLQFPTIAVAGPAIGIPVQLTFLDQTSLHPFQQGTAAGDHGHFEAIVQQWVSSPATSGVPPSGSGQWVPVSDPAGLLQNNAWNVFSVGANESNTQVNNLDLYLTQVDTFLRIGVYYNESDSRVNTDLDAPEIGSNQGSQPQWAGPYENPGCLTVQMDNPMSCVGTGFTGSVGNNSAAGAIAICDPTTGKGPVTGMCLGTGPPHVADSGTLVYNNGQVTRVAPSNTWIFGPPFRVVVEPALFIQHKAVPYTLLYMPPGNQSTQSFGVSQSNTTAFGFSVAVGGGTTTSNTYGDEQDFGGSSQAGVLQQALANGNILSPVLGAIPMPSYSISNGSAWSQSTSAAQSSTTNGTITYSMGQSQGGAMQVTASYPNGEPSPSATSAYYFMEPFWNDLFYLLVHPKTAVYNLSRCASGIMPPCTDGKGITNMILTRLMGADQVPATATVMALYQCLARGYELPPEPQFNANGTPVTDSNGNQVFKTDSLTPFDCSEILQADPFFAGPGQSAPLASPRALEADLYQSAFPPGAGFPPTYTISDASMIGWDAAMTNTMEFDAAIQTTATNSQVQSVALPFGLGTWTQTLTSSSANGITQMVAYGSSSDTSVQSVQNVAATLQDSGSYFSNAFDDPNADPQVIQVWVDNSFGTYMFRMPNVGAGPLAGRIPPPAISTIVQNGDGTYTISGQNLFAATSVSFSFTKVVLRRPVAVTENVTPSSPPTNLTSIIVPGPQVPRQVPPRPLQLTIRVTTPNGVSPPVIVSE